MTMMKRAFWSTIVASCLALSAVGCGGTKSCKDLCEAANTCPNVTEPVECEGACKSREELNKAAACEAQQIAFDECLSGLADVCDSSTACVTEALALFDCIDDYCTANPGGVCGGS
jgi:hypothetical protein